MLTRRCLVVALACAGALAQEPSASQAERPPNVVLILADDLGYGDLACYNEESRIPTPRLDALASEGTRFTDAHSPSGVCTPTRYGIMTGRYAWRTELKQNVLWPWDPPLVEDERSTLAELARSRGYRTACIGKWHLGWDWPLKNGKRLDALTKGVHLADSMRLGLEERIDFTQAIEGGPLDHGFDYYYGDDVPHFPPYAFVENDRLTEQPSASKPRWMFGTDGPAVPGWDVSVVLPTIARRSAVWLEERVRAAETPFFLYVAMTAPHTPIAPSTQFAGTSKAGAYGDFVHEVDWVVGVVLDSLERAGVAQETLVVFASDNGSPGRDGAEHMSGQVGSVRRLGHDPSGGWRGVKGDIWEGGHRIPLIVRWPGQVPAERVSDAPFVLTDLYRTLAAAMGADVPAGNGEDSFESLALWRGEADAALRDHLVHHSFHGMYAIRQGSWKLALGRGHGGFSLESPKANEPRGQLYDLASDPGEQHNRFLDEPQRVKELEQLLLRVYEQGKSF